MINGQQISENSKRKYTASIKIFTGDTVFWQ